MRIAVVGGGRSLERKFSLLSRHHVAAALRHLEHDAVELDVDQQLVGELTSTDLAFIALHGRDGEDGTIQLVCEAAQVPYTGSNPLTCRFSFDKGIAKALFRKQGIPTPPGYVLTEEAIRQMGAGAAVRGAAERLGYPLIVKPAAQGSALGLSLVADAGELSGAVLAALDHGDRVLLERYVDGTEVSVIVYGPERATLPPVEIKSTHDVHDFEARVSPGAVEYVPAQDLDADVLARTRTVAIAAADLLGIRDFGRVDIRIGDDGPMVLDVKTCPGLTETSIVSIAVAAHGWRFEDFVGTIVDAALQRSERAKAQ